MNKKAFTLVEVVIAALIVALLAGGMFSAFVGAYHFGNLTMHRLQAFNFAREALDKLRSNYQYTDSQMSVNLPSDRHQELEIGSIVRGEIAGLSSQLTYGVTEPESNGYKKVTVYVDWTEPKF